MRIIFMGTPDFAVPALRALAAAGHDVCAAYTQPPRPGGRRGRELTPSPVHRAADALGIPVHHPATLKTPDAQAAFAAHHADIAIVAAYGLILPRAVLDAPAHGCLNLHGSILPRWRGAAPIQRAILAGDAETGVDIMRMEAGLDTGPVLAGVRTPIADKTAGDLTAELAEAGAALIVRVLAAPPPWPETPQSPEGVTYAAKIDKAEARLDFTRSAAHVLRQIRAFAPTPGAYFELAGERYKVLDARIQPTSPHDLTMPFPAEPGLVLDDQLAIGCGDGAIRPHTIQRAGKPAMLVWDMLRGHPIPAGTRLG